MKITSVSDTGMNSVTDFPSENSFLAFAFFLNLLLTASFCIVVMGEWLGISLVHHAILLALLPCLAATYGYSFSLSHKNIAIGLLLGALQAGLCLQSYSMLDFTMDGISYHQPSAEAILNGWNPFYDEAKLWQRLLYPFGAWAIEACISALYGSTEAAKTLYIWLLFIVLPVILTGIRNTVGKMHARHYVLTWLLVFNPVVIAQLLTHYADGLLYLEGLIFLGAILMQGENPFLNRLSCFFMATSLLMMITSKLSGAYFGVMMCMCELVYLYFQEKRIPLRMFSFLLSAGIISIVVFAYHPYVSSLLKYHSLFPWDSAGLAAGVLPANFEGMPGFARFLYSLFSVTGGSERAPAILKWPWVVYPSEWLSMSPGTLIAGLGPLFAMGMLLTAILLLICISRRNNSVSPVNLKVASLALILFIFSMFFPQSWWARWAPFPYAVPLLLLIAIPDSAKPAHFGSWLIITIFIINNIPAIRDAWRIQHQTQAGFYSMVEELHQKGINFVSLVPVWAGENYQTTTEAYLVLERRLKEKHINSFVKPNATCLHKIGSFAEFDVCY